MEKMIERMMRELNITLSASDMLRERGNEKMADEMFGEFLAQAHLVSNVVDGKKVDINSDGIAVLIDWNI